jgi:hypothetical protein
MRDYNFLRLMSNKTTSRSYNHFSKFIFLFLKKKDMSGYVKNCKILLEMCKES